MRRRSLADLALTRPVMVGMLLVAVLILGVIATQRLPLAFLPSVGASTVSVRLQILRTPPELMEREVIRPIEEQLAGLRGLSSMSVGSGSWGVRVNLEFAPGTDIDARKSEVRERLDRVRGELPDTVQRITIDSWSSNDAPILSLRLASDVALRYRTLEDRVVRPIERIAGVSRVELEGVEPEELEIAVDQDDVRRAGVDSQAIAAAVRSARQGRSFGLLRQESSSPGVRSPGATADPEVFSRLPLVRTDPLARDRAPPRLGEVAAITIHPKEQRSFRRLDGLPGVNVAVYAEAGASPVEVSERVRAAIEATAKDPALGNAQVLVFEDQGAQILSTLSDLRTTGVFGGLLGVAVLFLFLRRWHVTAIAAVCIPLTLLATTGVLLLRGEELSCIVLLGLVLGVGALIDNAVVIVEAIERHRARGEAMIPAVLAGSREVALATFASTLSSVIVFLPLVFGPPTDKMSAYLRPLGTTFAIVLLCSLVISQTAVPLLMSMMTRGAPAEAPRIPTLERLAAAYRRLIERTLRWPRLTLIIGLLLASSAAIPASAVTYKIGDFDQEPESVPIALQLTGSPDYLVIRGHIEAIEGALLGAKDSLGLAHVSCHYSDFWGQCDVHPRLRAQSEAEVEEFRQRLSRALPERPSARFLVGEDRKGSSRRVDRNEVQLGIKGEDMGVLMELAQQIVVHLRAQLPRGDPRDPDAGGVDVITGPYDEGSREVHVRIDSTRARRAGLSADQLARLVSTAFQGVPMGKVRGEDGEIELRLSAGAMGPRADQGPGLAELRDLRVRLPSGAEVPLSNFAEFATTRSPSFVQRYDRETQVKVKVRFFSADPQENRRLVDEALAGFRFPPGYGAGDWIPWWREKQSTDEMVVNLALCLLLVYAVMASLFESFLQPLAILTICLLGCVGAPWAMWFTGTTVDTTAMVGLFILIGIVVNNGIMLIDRALQHREAGLPRAQALAQAGQDRLRPILMTASTTVLGIVPMLIHHPTLAGVYYHSVAIIIAGGLATSTVMTLIFLPATYSLLEDLASATIARWRALR
ncbi:MAG: efflux RND transporter permease subunit [Nannocystis sp.]|nr:efflux RND transporter permease subunit [Nannocystis sp.]